MKKIILDYLTIRSSVVKAGKIILFFLKNSKHAFIKYIISPFSKARGARCFDVKQRAALQNLIDFLHVFVYELPANPALKKFNTFLGSMRLYVIPSFHFVDFLLVARVLLKFS